MKKIDTLLSEILQSQTLIYAVISSPRKQSLTTSKKLTIRPVKIKDELFYQVSDQIRQKAIHRNISPAECLTVLLHSIREDFKQGLICTAEADYQLLVDRNRNVKILRKPATKTAQILLHNRVKQYLLQEGTAIPFLVELGVMTQEGKVVPSKRDKFRQINRFLELIDDIIPHLNQNSPLHIVDFGSGKAYLTFALYDYLTNIRKREVEIVGLDLKADVVDMCQELAKKLNYTHLNFFVGNIEQHIPKKKIDMVVTLHACDIATDAALEKAIHWNADVILSVPCCQHELFNQIENPTLLPILEHGILKERFSAIVTDAARVQIVRHLGIRDANPRVYRHGTYGKEFVNSCSAKKK